MSMFDYHDGSKQQAEDPVSGTAESLTHVLEDSKSNITLGQDRFGNVQFSHFLDFITHRDTNDKNKSKKKKGEVNLTPDQVMTSIFGDDPVTLTGQTYTFKSLKKGRLIARISYYGLMIVMVLSVFFFKSSYQEGKQPYIWYMMGYLVIAHVCYLRATFRVPGFTDLRRVFPYMSDKETISSREMELDPKHHLNIFKAKPPEAFLSFPANPEAFLTENVVNGEAEKLLMGIEQVQTEAQNFRSEYFHWEQSFSRPHFVQLTSSITSAESNTTSENSTSTNLDAPVSASAPFPATPSLTTLLYLLFSENRAYNDYAASTGNFLNGPDISASDRFLSSETLGTNEIMNNVDSNVKITISPQTRNLITTPPVSNFHMFLLRTITEHTRFCAKCRIVKPLLSRHCHTCGHCVARFDHHCPFVGNCVGANNHFLFLVFMWSHFPLIVYGIKVTLDSFPGFDIDNPYMYFRIAMTFVFCFAGLVILLLGTFHLYLMLSNTTTLNVVVTNRGHKSGLTKPGESLLKKYEEASIQASKDLAQKNQHLASHGPFANVDFDDIYSVLDTAAELEAVGSDEREGSSSQSNINGYSVVPTDDPVEVKSGPRLTKKHGNTFMVSVKRYIGEMCQFMRGFSNSPRLYTPLARIHYPPALLSGLNDFQTRVLNTQEEALCFRKYYFNLMRLHESKRNRK